MSHVAAIEFEGREVDVLAVAAIRCGGEFMPGQTSHAWWGTFVGDSLNMANSATKTRDPATFGRCHHAIRIEGQPGVNGSGGPWEIGVCMNGDGSFSLVYDNYGQAGRQLEAYFGKDLAKLQDEYCAEVSLRQLARDGFRLHEQRLDDGTIEILATR